MTKKTRGMSVQMEVYVLKQCYVYIYITIMIITKIPAFVDRHIIIFNLWLLKVVFSQEYIHACIFILFYGCVSIPNILILIYFLLDSFILSFFFPSVTSHFIDTSLPFAPFFPFCTGFDCSSLSLLFSFLPLLSFLRPFSLPFPSISSCYLVFHCV